MTARFRLLWADDEIDLLRPHILYLEERGFEVVGVPSGEDALQLIAGLIINQLTDLGLLEPVTEDGQERQNELFASHMKSLPFMYFQRGKDRLAGLKRWAAGEVTREKGEPLK